MWLHTCYVFRRSRVWNFNPTTDELQALQRVRGCRRNRSKTQSARSGATDGDGAVLQPTAGAGYLSPHVANRLAGRLWPAQLRRGWEGGAATAHVRLRRPLFSLGGTLTSLVALLANIQPTSTTAPQRPSSMPTPSASPSRPDTRPGTSRRRRR